MHEIQVAEGRRALATYGRTIGPAGADGVPALAVQVRREDNLERAPDNALIAMLCLLATE